jgi:hypothetical protein
VHPSCGSLGTARIRKLAQSEFELLNIVVKVSLFVHGYSRPLRFSDTFLAACEGSK